MSQETERKFIVQQLPDLSDMMPLRYERYYLSITKDTEERIQKKGDQFTYEKKVARGDLTRDTEEREISEEEFALLKQGATRQIMRDSYKLTTEYPRISIKVYHGDFEGLIRAEVEFFDEESAAAYIPESWMGAEITHHELGRDSRLLQLDRHTFASLLRLV